MTKTTDGKSEEQSKIVIRDRRRIDPETGVARQVKTTNVGAEVKASVPAEVKTPDDKTKTSDAAAGESEVTAKLAERIADLQRVTAEYANYRKRVDRDRQVAGEKATATLLTALLPVLDDIDRARTHGDLTGAFGAVAEQLVAVLTKQGLAVFGEAGEPFDPTVHEAVMHTVSDDVSEPTSVEVLRRGYLLGEKLLRAAMVAVAEPTDQTKVSVTESAGNTAPSTIDADEAAGAAAVD